MKRGGGGEVKATEYRRSDNVHTKVHTQREKNIETNLKKKRVQRDSNSRQID